MGFGPLTACRGTSTGSSEAIPEIPYKDCTCELGCSCVINADLDSQLQRELVIDFPVSLLFE
jgi:hypothetical protein